MPATAGATDSSTRGRGTWRRVVWSLRMAVLVSSAIHVANAHAGHLRAQAALVHR